MKKVKILITASLISLFSIEIQADDYYSGAQITKGNIAADVNGLDLDSATTIILTIGTPMEDRTDIEGVSIEGEFTKSISAASQS